MSHQKPETSLFYSSFLNTCHKTREEQDYYEGEHVRTVPFQIPQKERMAAHQTKIETCEAWDDCNTSSDKK